MKESTELFALPDLIFLAGVFGLSLWSAIALRRGRIRPYTLLSVAAVGLGLLMGVLGVAHTADVIGAKLRHGSPTTSVSLDSLRMA